MPKGQSDRLLIIEDNPDHWAIIQTVLKQYLPKAELIWAAEPRTATTYLIDCIRQQQHLPTLILLDLYLPKREMGLALLQQIKLISGPYCPSPVVVLSHSDADSDIEAMYQAGCSSYLVKPQTMNGWHELLQKLKVYWWDTVTRPQAKYSC